MPRLTSAGRLKQLATTASSTHEIAAPAPAKIIDRRRVHSISEVQEALGISHATVYTLFAKGLLVPRKILGKTVVTDVDLQAFVAGLARAPVRVRAGQQDAA